MSIDRLRAHWGFTRRPFSTDLAPSMLAATSVHHEAVARIGWCVTEDLHRHDDHGNETINTNPSAPTMSLPSSTSVAGNTTCSSAPTVTGRTAM